MDVNLVLLKKDGSQKVLPLPSRVTVIGRRRDCDLFIPLSKVSKRHCQLSYSKGELKVRDLGSRNGTIINGEQVDKAVIQPGDSIKIGPVTFVFQIDGQPETVSQSNVATQETSRKTKPKKDAAEEQFGSFAEFSDLDSLGETTSA